MTLPEEPKYVWVVVSHGHRICGIWTTYEDANKQVKDLNKKVPGEVEFFKVLADSELVR